MLLTFVVSSKTDEFVVDSTKLVENSEIAKDSKIADWLVYLKVSLSVMDIG